MNTDSFSCSDKRDQFVPLATGELPSKVADELHAHLDECLPCRAEWQTIKQAQDLAVGLQLVSPALDRYPEFLRRLATAETSGTGLVQVTEQKLQTVTETTPTTPGGIAALVPLFGYRLAVRNGFGKGFALHLTARDGRELLHVSAQSLAQAAVVVAGTSLFACGVIFLTLWFGTSLFRQPPQSTVQPAPPLESSRSNSPWLQTAMNEQWTLALWPSANQLQTSFLARRDHTLSAPLLLDTPLAQAPPTFTTCAAASDGFSFVVVREMAGKILAWRLEPAATQASSSFVLSERGAQPVIAWAGDRYLVVWIEADAAAPKIKLLEVTSDGRQMANEPVLVAETEQGKKVGSPAIAADHNRAMILYQLQGGELRGKFWEAATGLRPPPITIARHRGVLVNRPQLFVQSETYFACWGETMGANTELRLAKITPQGEASSPRTLVSSSQPITHFAGKLTSEAVALIWAEMAGAEMTAFQQRFSLAGDPLQPPAKLQLTDGPASFAWAETEREEILWHEPRRSALQLKRGGMP